MVSYSSIYNLIGLKKEVDRLQTQANLGFDKEFRTLKWLGLKDGMNILDVGAGPGFYSELLLNNLPNSKITLLEVNEDLMQIAKERLSKYPNDRVEFVETSILDNKLNNNQYDFVICRFVFQHLSNPVLASKEIYNLLKPGGIVTIIDSDRGLWGVSEPDFLVNSGSGYIKQIEKRTRWNREVGRRLVKVLKNTGFTDLDFDAVTIHSDLVGLKNMLGDITISKDQYNIMMKNNPRLAKIVKLCSEITTSDNCTVILLNLIAKGVK